MNPTDSENPRGCQCGLWKKDPAFLEDLKVPRGYCGFCETCGKPGHTRHFPGSMPYTGCWCDHHHRRRLHGFRFGGELAQRDVGFERLFGPDRDRRSPEHCAQFAVFHGFSVQGPGRAIDVLEPAVGYLEKLDRQPGGR